MASASGEARPERLEESSARAKAKKQRQGRRYGFACANCRRRKARCDEGVPSCNRCLTAGEDCVFNKAPSVTYAIALQNNVSTYESLLEQLQNSDDAGRLRILEQHFTSGGCRPPRYLADSEALLEESPQSDLSGEDELTEILEQTSVDEDGRICFYGSTSLFHIRPTDQALSSRTAPSHSTDVTDNILLNGAGVYQPMRPEESLHLSSEQFQAKSMISSSTEPQLVADGQTCHELLETYWCWPHHLHLVLCRKLFMRDMTSGGPYFNTFLLNSVLSQAARFSDRRDANFLREYFSRLALDSLTEVLDKGSSIPTIQGLLILSAHKCACGRTSQGWLYSGMAFRMMQDMGIHIPPTKLNNLVGQFSSEELALRQQLFWSCYTWDKTMSLCLGRAPIIHEVRPVIGADDLLDGIEAENGPWRPKFATTSALEDNGIQQHAKSNSRFAAYCQLCIHINEILDSLYSKPHTSQQELHGFFDRSSAKLKAWTLAIPAHLFVQPDSRAVSCPPLHILILNLLYHATIILLCRPYRSTKAQARSMATSAAEMIDRLFMLHVRRFGFRVITWLESYTIFVASTVNILDLKEGIDVEGARARIALGLEVLRNTTSTPSNTRCVEIIHNLLYAEEERKKNKGTNESHTDLPGSLEAEQDLIVPQNTQPPSSSLQFSAPSGSNPEPLLGVQGNVGNNDTIGNVINQSPTNFSTLHTTQDDPEAGENTNADVMITPIGAPLRWLPDNVGNDFEWMMMEEDFNVESPDAHGAVLC